MAISTDALYNLASNTFIFGPVNISGFGDDGAVEYTALSEDDIETVVGYDGTATPNAILSWAWIAEIKVREGSATYKALGALLQAQRLAIAQGLTVPRYAWYHKDGTNGDEVKDTNCIITAGPTMSKTNRYSVRSFKILIPNAKLNALYGINNP